MNYLVISCIGPDKVGLVDSLSKIINAHQGNWQVSSLHHLSGYFAGVIEVAISADNTQPLTKALHEISGLSCQIELAEPNLPQYSSHIVLELTANDRVGIVQDVASVIHHQGGNLLKLVSSQDNAAHTGQVMFKAKAHIAMKQQNSDELIAALEQIADDLMVDISR